VLRDRRVPANLHVRTLNPHIDVGAWNLAPVTEPLDLGNERLVVGVSAFGFGGTNAHAVLTSYQDAAAAETRGVPPVAKAQRTPPLLLSARSPQALRDVSRDMALHLRTRLDQSEYDITYSAAYHRDLYPHRLAASAVDRHALAHALEQFASTGCAVGITLGKCRPEASAPAFVYQATARSGPAWACSCSRTMRYFARR